MTFEEVFKNKDFIIAQKKNAIKHCDVVITTSEFSETSKNEAEKLDNPTSEDINPNVLQAKLVINTTNIIDSHRDCHIPNLWTKSLQETKVLYLLQEHDMDFDKVIADSIQDGLKAYTQSVSWSKLGYTYEGKTQALIFDTQIKKDVNPFMFDMYKKNRVYNHSVGMRYVKIFLCADRNEAEYSQEKENWNKYYPLVVNKEKAQEKGYFWAVTEAKVIEGSAVIKGSNECTPVMEIEFGKEAVKDTSNQNTNEPSNDTQSENKQFFINLLN
jgi:hypothetical protein